MLFNHVDLRDKRKHFLGMSSLFRAPPHLKAAIRSAAKGSQSFDSLDIPIVNFLRLAFANFTFLLGLCSASQSVRAPRFLRIVYRASGIAPDGPIANHCHCSPLPAKKGSRASHLVPKAMFFKFRRYLFHPRSFKTHKSHVDEILNWLATSKTDIVGTKNRRGPKAIPRPI